MSLVHALDSAAAAQTPHRDVAVGAIADTESTDVGRSESYVRRTLARIVRVPEDVSRSRELIGNSQGRSRGCGGGRSVVGS